MSRIYLFYYTTTFFLIASTVTWIPNSRIQNRDLIAPPNEIKHFTFGYSEVLSDMFWIRAIQDFDFCETQIAHNVCQNRAWLFQVINLVSDLSPKFKIVYETGGLALSVLVSDIEGATVIFDKGLKNFPNHWPLAYRAAYHYLYEVRDKKRAAELLNQAGANGAPPWVYTLAGRLYSDSGELDLAKAVLFEMRETNQDPVLIKRLEEKIASIEAEQAAKK